MFPLFFPIHIYIYIYRYHTITDVYTTALLLTKPSSDDDSGFRHGFGVKASLPLAQSAPAVALWNCQINDDAVWALSWIFSMYFLLSNGGSPRLVKKTEVQLAIKPLHPTSIGNTYIYISLSSSCASGTDIPDPLSPPLSIIHRFQQVLRATSRIYTELLYVGSSWSPCLCSSMWRGP